MADQSKICRRCMQEKPAELFYLRAGRLSSWCRPCSHRYTLQWRADNPGKHRAHRAIQLGIKMGRIKRPDRCEACGSGPDVIAHHPDYRKPLEVTWLCDSCHVRLHWAGREKKGGRPKGSKNKPKQIEGSS